MFLLIRREETKSMTYGATLKPFAISVNMEHVRGVMDNGTDVDIYTDHVCHTVATASREIARLLVDEIHNSTIRGSTFIVLDDLEASHDA